MTAKKQIITLLNGYNSGNIDISVKSDLFLGVAFNWLSFIEPINNIECQFNLSIKKVSNGKKKR